MPRVSVIMPVYQTPATFLREAIDSVLAQSMFDFELLVVNDCPTDKNFAAILKSYHDPRIRWQENSENLGAAAARNLLLAQAQSEYIAILDSDDAALPERFAKQVDFLDNHPEIGVVGSFVETMNRRKKILRYPIFDPQIKIGMLGSNMFAHSSVMMRRNMLTNNLVEYDTSYQSAEAYALFVTLLPLTNFHNLPEVLTRHRLYAGSFSRVNRDRMRRSEMLIRFLARRNNPLLAEKFDSVARVIVQYRIFNLPIFSIERQFDTAKFCLFGSVPIFTKRTKRQFNQIF